LENIAGDEGAAQTTTTTANGSGSKSSKKQTNPPSIPICELYPDGNFPEGQIVPHGVPKDQDE
jgi:methionyl aminopeptidase